MTGTELAALRDDISRYGELGPVVSDRTLDIVERRRKTATIRRRGWLVRRALLAADVVGLVLAFFAAQALFGAGSSAGNRFSPGIETLLFLASLPGWIVVAKIYGLYERDEERADHTTVDDAVAVFHMTTVGAWLLFGGMHVIGVARPELQKMMTFWILAIAAVVTARASARMLCRRSVAYLQNAVIVGAGDVGQLVARKLLHHPEYGINLVGFVDAQPKERRPDLEHLTILGAPDRLPSIVRLFDVERVIFAFSGSSHEELVELVRALKRLDVQVDIVPRLFDVVGPNVDTHTVEGVPLVGLPPLRMPRSSRLVKRAVDIVGASVLLVATGPLFAFIAWRIKRDSPGPVFFRQRRLGINMREFTALKFRTMRVGISTVTHEQFIRESMSATPTESSGLFKLDRADAVTSVGRWLRQTSLDELPQLINVLLGDMSLVGPRPCIPYEVEHFAPHHFERFLVPAGITGLWQVTARAHSTFGEALDMDVAYARSWSLGLDLSLLLRTPLQVFNGSGRTA